MTVINALLHIIESVFTTDFLGFFYLFIGFGFAFRFISSFR